MADNLVNNEKITNMIKQSIIFKTIKRKSGGYCDYYINGKRIVLNSELVIACSKSILDIAIRLGATHVGGEVASALPLVGSIITLAALEKYQLDGFFIRETEKEYGFNKIIEGEFTEKSVLLLVDDVIGKGSIAIRCCKLLREEGLKVIGFCAIVDRGEGADDLLKAEGVELYSLCKTDNIKDWIDLNINQRKDKNVVMQS